MSSIDKDILTKDEESEDTTKTESSISYSLKIDHMKNPHRIKLAPDEIKLIMFLIVEIKPFKYIGDKSLSQTKKWELIRTRYYDAKANNKDVEVIVPTVRTLQRQLTAGLKKAETRRKKKRVYDSIDQISDTEKLIQKRLDKLSVESATDQELEDMIYDLNELSDHIKKTKSNPQPRPSSIQRIMNPSPESTPQKQQRHFHDLHHHQQQQQQPNNNSTQTHVLSAPVPPPPPPPPPPQPALPQVQSFSPPIAQATPIAPRLFHDPQPSPVVQLLLQIVEELQTEIQSMVDRLRSIKQKLDRLK